MNQRAGVGLAAGLTGALVGLVAGIALDAVIWLWAFSRALAGDVGAGFPLVVTTAREQGDVIAASGIGIVVIPAVFAAVGLAVGCVLRRGTRRRTMSAAARSR